MKEIENVVRLLGMKLSNKCQSEIDFFLIRNLSNNELISSLEIK